MSLLLFFFIPKSLSSNNQNGYCKFSPLINRQVSQAFDSTIFRTFKTKWWFQICAFDICLFNRPVSNNSGKAVFQRKGERKEEIDR